MNKNICTEKGFLFVNFDDVSTVTTKDGNEIFITYCDGKCDIATRMRDFMEPNKSIANVEGFKYLVTPEQYAIFNPKQIIRIEHNNGRTSIDLRGSLLSFEDRAHLIYDEIIAIEGLSLLSRMDHLVYAKYSQ